MTEKEQQLIAMWLQGHSLENLLKVSGLANEEELAKKITSLGYCYG